MMDGDRQAREQLTRLLRMADQRPDRVLPAAIKVTLPGELNAAAHRAWQDRLEMAARLGAIEIGYGKGNQRDAIRRITLKNPEILATQILGVQRAADHAVETYDAVVAACGGRCELLAVADEALARWSQGKAWERLEPDPAQAAADFACALGLLEGAFSRSDRRSVALQVAGSSKYLDRRGGVVATILKRALDLPGDLGPDDVFARLDIRRFGQPVCLRAPLFCNVPCDNAPWIGLCSDAISDPIATGTPPYILFIENWSSFNRHVREILDGAAVLYTGGFPSHGVRAMAALLSRLWPSAPVAHWGDIDAGGLLIAEAMNLAAARLVVPHLMSSDLASANWRMTAPLKRVMRIAEREDAWGDLARFLTGPQARTLEQEALDPQPFSREG